jgi:hypothetical protein
MYRYGAIRREKLTTLYFNAVTHVSMRMRDLPSHYIFAVKTYYPRNVTSPTSRR